MMQSLFSENTSFFNSVACMNSPAYQKFIWTGQQSVKFAFHDVLPTLSAPARMMAKANRGACR